MGSNASSLDQPSPGPVPAQTAGSVPTRIPTQLETERTGPYGSLRLTDGLEEKQSSRFYPPDNNINLIHCTQSGSTAYNVSYVNGISCHACSWGAPLT